MRTQDLIGAQLDWAVAKCEGYECEFGDEVSGPWLVPQEGYLHDEKPLASFRPSTNWAQGGPLSERETLCLEYDKDWVYDPATADPDDEPDNGDRWMAWPSKDQMRTVYGPTPLIAAMRCFCCSKLGDVVDIPEELCQQQRS